MSLRRPLALALGVAVAAAAGLIASPAASSAPAPPKISMSLSFPVGGHLNYLGDWDPEYPGIGYSTIPITFRWKTDAPDHQTTVWKLNDNGPPATIVTGAAAGSYSTTIDDWTADYGCSPCVFAGYAVLAYDSTGTVYTTRELGSMPIVRQENGDSPGAFYNDGSLKYAGTWKVSAGPWAGGGEQRYTTGRKASVRYGETFAAGGGIIGVVMAKGPKRGKAWVLVDGTKVATVNTHASTNDNQVIVWSGQVGAGWHKVKVVNAATPGHRRIDIDAFVTMNLRPGIPPDLPCDPQDCS